MCVLQLWREQRIWQPCPRPDRSPWSFFPPSPHPPLLREASLLPGSDTHRSAILSCIFPALLACLPVLDVSSQNQSALWHICSTRRWWGLCTGSAPKKIRLLVGNCVRKYIEMAQECLKGGKTIRAGRWSWYQGLARLVTGPISVPRSTPANLPKGGGSPSLAEVLDILLEMHVVWNICMITPIG